MADHACQNRSCKSFGQPHPNCLCPSPHAEGGEAKDFCATSRAHLPECQYFSEGGEAALPPGFSLESSEAPVTSDVPAGFQLEEDKYGSLPQQALTAVEGIGEGVAGPLFTAAERATGLTTPEDMLARRDTNPVSHGVGQAVGLAGSTLLAPELSAAKMLTGAGKAASAAVGLGEAASTFGKIASAGVRGASEMALLQGSDEISKMIMKDPDTSFQSAIADVGLAAALGAGGGAALGAINPLWNMSGGKKIESFLGDFQNRVNEHVGALGPVLEIEKPSSGIKLADALFNGKVSELSSKALSESAATTVGGAVGSLVGHPWVGALIGERMLGPFFDAVLPPLLEPMMNKAIDSAAFKSAIDYGLSVYRGQQLLTKAAENVLVPGAEVLSGKLIPTAKDREKLQNRLDEMSENPDQTLNSSDPYLKYLEHHSSAKGSVIGSAYEYLKSIRPVPHKNLMFDQEIKPNEFQTSEYDQALNLAQQPLTILPKIKDGTITDRDIDVIRNLYPALHQSAIQRLHNAVLEHTADGSVIPYETRMGLAKFFREPLDSTMLPQNIAAIQQSFGPASPYQDDVAMPRPDIAPRKGADKQASRMMTATQAAEAQNTTQS